MKIFNTLSRSKENFTPLNKKIVKIYTCGPTVYNYPTIANLRTYINQDLLRRFLEYNGYKVIQAMNITDIDDKIINKSINDHKSYKIITQKYEKIFFDNLDELNIERPEYSPHATDPEAINQMIEIIQDLLKKEIAYKSNDGSIYFSVNKFMGYGKLSGLNISGIKDGARVDQDEYSKENAQDFALWKANKEGEPSWDAPFGTGRPGWHIECSAMSTKYLGKTIDIHSGGIDLIFPHHENEIALSESYTGKKFVNYWVHCEHLLIDGQRMGKSLNNFYTLDDLKRKFKVEPMAYRLLCLMSHYREKLNFTDSSIHQAQNTLLNLIKFVKNNLKGNSRIDTNSIENDFLKALVDDLNTPKAMAILFEFINKVNINNTYGPDVHKLLLKLDRFMGLRLENIKPTKATESIEILLEERNRARSKKDWELSDRIRRQIDKLGYTVEDTKNGSIVTKK